MDKPEVGQTIGDDVDGAVPDPPHTQDNAGDVVGVEGAGDDSQADAVIRDKLVDHMQGPEAGVHKEVAHGLHKGALEDMAPTLDKRFHSSLGHHRE